MNLLALLLFLIALVVISGALLRAGAGTPANKATRPEIERIEQLLPQTQCGDCGFPGCRPYARAIIDNQADINRCLPGGMNTVRELAAVTGKTVKPLYRDSSKSEQTKLAVIDEAVCIGCVKCIRACPVDAILGAPKLMHSVINKYCTGCELCIAPCPVDCISMVEVR